MFAYVALCICVYMCMGTCICVYIFMHVYVYMCMHMHDAYVIIYIMLYLGGTILGVHGGMRRERYFLGDAAMTFKSLRH